MNLSILIDQIGVTGVAPDRWFRALVRLLAMPVTPNATYPDPVGLSPDRSTGA
jgi:hypothetical protein